jgi:tight adherence protein B
VKLINDVMSSLKTDAENGNTGETDYDIYVLTKKELFIYLLIAISTLFTIAYVFYHNITLSILVTPFALLYPKVKIRDIIEKRRNDLEIQFKDMLYSISSSMYAGKSMESSFSEALNDLKIIYPDEDTYILKEVKFIIKKIEMNQTVEEAIEDFSKRAKVEDIENFVEVFRTCRKTGGNLLDIIRNTSNIINSKIQTKIEIETMIAQRKLEQKILSAMPVVLILILSLSAEEYMAPIFETTIGKFVMTIALIIIGIGYFISKKVMDIKV